MKTTYVLPVILITLLNGCIKKPSSPENANVLTTIPTTTSVIRTTMKGFTANIEKDAIDNTNYRKVLYTGHHMQLVLMTLNPGEEIGEEVHTKSDQFFRFESGKGTCTVNETQYKVVPGDIVFVPSGAKHNVINTDPINKLKLYTLYALPNHKDGIVRATKEDAETHEAKFDGKTTEN
jgi:mannose-6-phosphate isomerase-like protein (cupin superfamily)